MKEYGGFLPLELPRKQEFFSEIDESNKLRLNCGRSTFYCAVKDSGVKKVYMPYLNCINSVDPIIAAGAEVEYYYLNEDLTPKDIVPQDGEAVMWINYYGNAFEEQIEKVSIRYETLFVDNCHAFFSKPLKNAYNCYSTRKFFGVADGAYLIKENVAKIALEESRSAQDTLFILKTVEEGTNAVYSENLYNEQRVASDVLKMSPLTQRILQSIDYEDIKKKRYENFRQLHRNLEEINEFNVNVGSGTHMYYPLLVFQDSLREKLVKNKIYTPTWWKHVPEQSNYGKVETALSKYMLMIPMDQRYDTSDMDDISEIIYSCLEK